MTCLVRSLQIYYSAPFSSILLSIVRSLPFSEYYEAPLLWLTRGSLLCEEGTRVKEACNFIVLRNWTVIGLLLAGKPSFLFPQCIQMTKSYLNFESVISNLTWLAGSGALKDLERQTECVWQPIYACFRLPSSLLLSWVSKLFLNNALLFQEGL